VGYDGDNPNTVFKIDDSGTSLGSGTWPIWAWYGGGTGYTYCCYYDASRNYLFVGGAYSNNWDGATGWASLWALDADDGSVIWSADLGGATYDMDFNAKRGEIVCIVGGSVDGILRVNADSGTTIETFDLGASVFSSDMVRIRPSDGAIIYCHRDALDSYEGAGDAANVITLTYGFDIIETYLLTTGAGVERAHVAWLGDDGDFVFAFSDISGDGTDSFVSRYNSSGVVQWTFHPGYYTFAIAVTARDHVVVSVTSNSDWDDADGDANFFVLNPVNGSVITSTDVTEMKDWWRNSIRTFGGELNLLSTREASLIVVSGGTVKKVINQTISTPTGGSGALTTQPYRVQMTELFSKVFMVDGVNSLYYDLNDNEVKDWASNVTAGTLQANARLIARFRGRAVLSGVRTDPHNWFASAAGDPFDFDYSPATVTSTQAVAGNASEVGIVGDVVTALIPFSDDAMLIGGDRSIWQMSGDPADSGSIDLVSDVVGIAWGKAWTLDENDILYFMSVDGVYMLEVGGKPVSLTDGRLNKRFKAIDLASTRVVLAWDFLRKGLLVIAAGVSDLQAQTVLFWDKRTDSWTEDTYGSLIGPSAVYGYDSELPDDNQMLFGCKDGYVREIDETASDDDGTDIPSVVRYSPFPLGDGYTEGMLTGINATLAEGSGDVMLKVFVGQTAEQATEETSPRFTRTLSAGANSITSQRVRGAWAQVELSQSTGSPWAVESVYATIEESGLRGRLRR
jgi:hypothetical protein